MHSECALTAVYVGSWSGAPTVGATGQAFSVRIPTADLAWDAAVGTGILSNVCTDEEDGTAVGSVTPDGTVTLPVAVHRVAAGDPTCLADFVYTFGRPDDWLTLEPVPATLPDDASATSTVTLTPDANAIGQPVTWLVTDGSVTPASGVVLEDPACNTDGACIGIATATVAATTGKPRVLVTATVAGVSESVELPIIDAPVFVPATATIERGEDLQTDVITNDKVAGWSAMGCDGFEAPLFTSPTVTAIPLVDVAYDADPCTITVWDTFGQRGTLTLTVAPGDPGPITITTDVDWIPDDNATPALVTVTAGLNAVGASVTLTGATFSPTAPVVGLETDTGTTAEAVATSLYTSSAAGRKTLVATIDGYTATTQLLVAAAPEASVATLTGEGTVDFRTDGTFLECGYTGGGSWTIRTEDGNVLGTTDPLYTSLTDIDPGQVLTLRVPAPAGTAEAWCTDRYGRAATVTVSPASETVTPVE